jgi:hypothetical protein
VSEKGGFLENAGYIGRMVLRPGIPPRFRVNLPPKATAILKLEERGKYRGSPRDRGYDARWDKLSVRFRRANPFCRLCEQEGADQLGARVDHILPVREYPDLKYDWNNLQNICVAHDNLKQAMETFARANGQVELLKIWCEGTDLRPEQFRQFRA